MQLRALPFASAIFLFASHDVGSSLSAYVLASRAAPTAATGVITGVVVIAGTQVPLSYSVVSIDAIKLERFTDGNGRFALFDVPTGRVVVRAKHIGYTPVDVPVTVAAGDTIRIRIELTKVVVQLPTMTSVGACTKPGAPRREANPALFVLFDQVRQNAERSRLLTRSYPFTYAVSRTRTRQSSLNANAPPDTEFIDTLRIASQHDWRYKPGNMVIMEHDGRGISEVLVLPELGDFADDAFIANHCFGYSGVETVEGEPLVRVDFSPADKIKQPDIAGVLYLDSATFQIQRAELRLTKPSTELLTRLKTVTVESRYSEVSPGIPMMSSYSAITGLSDYERRAGWATSSTTQHMIDVVWLKGPP